MFHTYTCIINLIEPVSVIPNEHFELLKICVSVIKSLLVFSGEKVTAYTGKLNQV